jgi:RNA-directed DNA polymerase
MLFNISTKKDLAKLLKCKPHEIDYIGSRLPHYYRPKSQPKADGKIRKLYVPHGKLKEIQRQIKAAILDRVKWASAIHGGVRHRSILSNASMHTRKPVVYALDVKDCFPSIGRDRVLRVFRGLGFENDAAELLTILTTWKFQLPQGAHTSTGLANLALAGIDVRVAGVAEKHGFTYTRYVDDITVSGDWRLLKFRGLLIRIVEYEGFRVKTDKVETMPMGTRQVVTKLAVNGKVNLPREKRESIRRELLAHLKDPLSHLTASASGRMHWLKFINPELGKSLFDRLEIGDEL